MLEQIGKCIETGKAKDVERLVTEALDSGVSPKSILEDAMIKAMSEVGVRFKANQIFVPQVLIAARAMNMGLKVLRPALLSSGVEPIGKAIICTVQGDMHDIGKNLVKMMLEGQGIECIDLGVDVSPQKVCEAVIEHNPQIVCLSALLTTTMPAQKLVIDELIKEGLRDKVKVMIGGAPVTQSYADEIGADYYTPDASTCATVACELLRK